MRRRHRLIVGLLLAAAAVLSGAASALACPTPATRLALAHWGDTTQFVAVPGGSFENGPAWSATGAAAPVSGGDPAALNPSTYAMRLSSGDSLTSPPMCLDADHLYLRFVALAGGAHTHLHVVLRWTDARGRTQSTGLGDLDSGAGYARWALAPALRLHLPTADPSVPGSGDVTGRFVFTVGDRGGSWTLDDVNAAVTQREACPWTPTADPYAAWGVQGDYSEVPGGSFEGPFLWTPTGTPAVVSPGNPYGIDGSSASAARLHSGDAIVSRPFCIDRYHPYMRFVDRHALGAAHLKLAVLWTDNGGKTQQSGLADIDPNRVGSAWGVSPAVDLGKPLPSEDGSVQVRLRFYVDGRDTSWLLDDVWVDPWKRG